MGGRTSCFFSTCKDHLLLVTIISGVWSTCFCATCKINAETFNSNPSIGCCSAYMPAAMLSVIECDQNIRWHNLIDNRMFIINHLAGDCRTELILFMVINLIKLQTHGGAAASCLLSMECRRTIANRWWGSGVASDGVSVTVPEVIELFEPDAN